MPRHRPANAAGLIAAALLLTSCGAATCGEGTTLSGDTCIATSAVTPRAASDLSPPPSPADPCDEARNAALGHDEAASSAKAAYDAAEATYQALIPEDEAAGAKNRALAGCDNRASDLLYKECLDRFEAREGFREYQGPPAGFREAQAEMERATKDKESELLLSAQITVNNPDCFTPDDVALAQQLLAG